MTKKNRMAKFYGNMDWFDVDDDDDGESSTFTYVNHQGVEVVHMDKP
jgi:hypothetical protein